MRDNGFSTEINYLEMKFTKLNVNFESNET